ncbi:cyclic GMP-AMP synthase DncV-like nucleotidyltransferase [Aneurinibacillus uraniidurans]|uniref:cyclic GMP-AMP synthase DncV-like nucleotidyltransferase n=1 Tax=Aneurinibacillus uraniidurans TaxID=2966586 RepID=UPI00234914FA|nr:nucleotidyltransferase [Aneurinibacillus sp. B1]WCN36486.1 nucleotidyltransferase [Aneurinibacillus sp. B1]
MSTSMYNASAKFNAFYNDHVVLRATDQTELKEKKDLNIDRLVSGLAEYNEEHKTKHTLIDHKIQGSMAMSTIVQNEENEYDIDVAIIFNKDDLPDGTIATKNIIVDALERKCKRFKTEPEAKTNCVRVEYASGYHIDFAVYRKSTDEDGNDVYEHCGSAWRNRDPEVITKWFNDSNTDSNGNIRKVVRLLKMFCKSRSGWSMPGGLIQSVLAEECIQSKDRIDETFYYTIKAIRDRLEDNKEVYNPKDSDSSLLLNAKDHQKVKNLHTRLTNYISKLDVLFKDDCTENQAFSAWKDFFNHSYWGELITETAENRIMLAKSYGGYTVEIVAQVEWNPGEFIPLNEVLGPIPKDKYIQFTAIPSFFDFSKVEWEVVNDGDECVEEKDLGHFKEGISVREHTAYRGVHKMICRVYRQGNIVCEDYVRVQIK